MATLKEKLHRAVGRRWLWALPIVLFGILVVAMPAMASTESFVMEVIGSICQAIVWFLGQLTLLVVGILLNIAQYNSFATEAMVGVGWTVVRDVCNMFFIAVLMLMAFGTIVPGVGKFTIHGGNLSKLLITAVVINFSRTICALLIDLSQVVMLTFVSGFKDAAGGNFVNALGLTKILQENPSSVDGIGLMTAVVAYLLAIVMTAIALFTVTAIAVSLLVRIIYLWLLVIISPLAFFSRAIPAGFAGSIYGKWWSKFTEMLIGGPLQAFFLWLALVAVQAADFGSGFASGNTGETVGGASAAFQELELQKFIVAVCLLLIGNMLAKDYGGAATSMGLSAAKWAKGKAFKYGRNIGRLGLRGGLLAGGAGLRGADRLTAKVNLGQDVVAGQRLTVGEQLRATGMKIRDQLPLVGTKAEQAKQLEKMQSEARTLSASGRLDEAKKAQAQVDAVGSARMAQKYREDPVGLRRELTDGKSDMDRRFALLALSKAGDGTLKGKGKEFLEDEVKKITGGQEDKALLASVIANLKAVGDKRAEMERKDVQDIMDKKPTDQAAFIRGGKVETDETGRLADPLYAHYLKGVSLDDVAKMKANVLEKLLDDYIKSIEAAKASGDDGDVRQFSAKLSGLADMMVRDLKPGAALSKEQADRISATLGVTAESLRSAGQTERAAAVSEKQTVVSGEKAILHGAASSLSGGDDNRAKRLMAEFMDSFGKKMEQMNRAELAKKGMEERKQWVSEAAGTARLLQDTGHASAGSFRAHVQNVAGLDDESMNKAQEGTTEWWSEIGRSEEQERIAAARARIGETREKVTYRTREALASGKAEESGIDRSVAAVFRGSIDASDKLRKGIYELQDVLDRLNTGQSDLRSAKAEIAAVSDRLSETVATAKKPTVLDDKGQPIANPYGRSQAGRVLKEAAEGSDSAAVAKALREALRQMTTMASGRNAADRQVTFEKTKEAKFGMESSARGLESALREPDVLKRAKETQRAAITALTSLKTALNEGEVDYSSGGRTAIAELEGVLKSLKRAEKVGEAESTAAKLAAETLRKLAIETHTPAKPK